MYKLAAKIVIFSEKRWPLEAESLARQMPRHQFLGFNSPASMQEPKDTYAKDIQGICYTRKVLRQTVAQEKGHH